MTQRAFSGGAARLDAPLRAWALRVVARRGKPIAVLTLARRLAGALYALLRDGMVFAPRRSTPPATDATLAGAATV